MTIIVTDEDRPVLKHGPRSLAYKHVKTTRLWRQNESRLYLRYIPTQSDWV